jgi:hypothetical protein
MAKELDTREVSESIAVVQRDYRTRTPRTGSDDRIRPGTDANEEITTADGCRAKADMLRATAGMLSDPMYRSRALKIADRWAALAAEYEAGDCG